MRSSWLLVVALLLLSCDPGPSPEPSATRLGILVRAEDRVLAEGIAGLLPEGSVAIRERPDPAAALGDAIDELSVALVIEPAICDECYRLDSPAPERVVVHGDAPLGVQYGLAHALEAHGVRFFHPWRAHVPEGALAAIDAFDGATIEPETPVRGLHLHIIHPIEAHFALWESNETSIPAARRMFAWVVANRGNFVAWPGLDSIETPAEAERWRTHTRELLDIAHGMGLRVGFGLQLFGTSNLQFAFDLIDDSRRDPAEQISERLDILGALPFDSMSISFGEFSGVEPTMFVDTLELTYDAIQERWPGIEVSASIHVGAEEALRVTWMGEEMIYYFLAMEADRPIVPWIHTVMYYDLVEDAGGAYHHDDFSEHFDLMIRMLGEGREVAYFPESAYWVAFDNPIPTYLPLYVRSRWLDLDAIRTRAQSEGVPALQQHVTFSSGWEWGYWQNDVATLRASHHLPARWEDLFVEMLAPWGAEGEEAAESIIDLTRAQHTALIEQRLAPWYGSVDVVIELGYTMGIVSQPRRLSFEEITAMTEPERAAFGASVVEPMGVLANASEAALARLMASGVPQDDPFVAELIDGFAIDVQRARFVEASLRATLASAAGTDPIEHLAAMQTALDAARPISARRHAALHDPNAAELVARRRNNATLYDYGYLREASTLCFWTRELAQVRNLILHETAAVPACVL
ncbi:MAG: hypothetical protein M3Y87_12420 [Myxococcota bacterium]|nr:hypothetical protein [Myxococcota bacterium]